MNGFTNLRRVSLALAILVLLPLSDLMSQKFIMETAGATYNATCGGVIKMKTVAAAPGQAEIVRNNGNLLGTNEANAIKGIVEWAGTSVTQVVQGNLYYEKMLLSGGANKTIQDGVYITGIACNINDLLPGYGDFATYPFFITGDQIDEVNDFQGTFSYLGGPDVTVFPVTDNDSYNNLALDGTGSYTIPGGGEVTVEGEITLPTGDLFVDGTLNTGSTDSDLLGDVTISDGGSISIGEGDLTFSGDLNIDGLLFADDNTIGDPTGTVIIAGDATINGPNGSINFGDDTELEISGTIENNGDGTNLLFACSSTVTYNDANPGQLIMPTLATAGNSYGNLVLTGGNKVGGLAANYDNNVNICADFTLDVSGGILDMTSNNGYLQMLAPTGIATYGNGTGLDEVRGPFRRILGTGSGALINTDYVFNNYQTALAFGTLPTGGDYFEFNVRPDQSPNVTHFDDDTDIDRRITLSYDVTNWVATIQAGYLPGEVPTSFPAGLSEADLRYFEADGTNIEKLAGTGYNNNSTGAFRYVRMSGVEPGLAAQLDGIVDRQFASGHELFMRASNIMYSIVDGRWSNPNVWDEGRIPNALDNIELRTMVYVGIDGEFAGTIGGVDNTPTLNTRAENDDYTDAAYVAQYGSSAAARMITIANVDGAALIIGNEDNGANYVHQTAFNGTAFMNKNTTAPTPAFPIAAKTTFTSSNHGFNGLWLTDFGANPAALGTQQLENEGTINNQGIIEIGD